MLKAIAGYVMLFALSICTALGQAQFNVEGGIHSSLLFKSYSSNNGLPDVRIRNIYQDASGYLWVGTMNGLCRFDGYSFTKYYKTSKGNSISGNWARAIAEDAAHNLWFGTEAGLNRFDANSEKFTNYSTHKTYKGLLGGQIDALHYGKAGNLLWIGTANGLICLNTTSQQLKSNLNYPFNTGIVKIINAEPGWLWMACKDGVIHFNIKTGHHQLYKIAAQPNPYGDIFWSLMMYGRDLYIGTGGDGLMRLRFDSLKHAYKSFEYINNFAESRDNLTGKQVFDICSAPSGDMWLATEHGLAKIENVNSAAPKLTIYRNNALSNKSLPSNIVYKVFVDRNAVLWCGSEAGLSKLDLNSLLFNYYTFVDKTIKDRVRGISSFNGTDVWFGTSNTGVFKYNIQNQHLEKIAPGNFGTYRNNRIIYTAGKQVWAGGLNGAGQFNADNPVKINEVVKGKAVFAVLTDSQGTTWIGTKNGILLKAKTGIISDYDDVKDAHPLLKRGFVRVLFEDSAHRIWIGFENGKVGYVSPTSGIFTTIENDTKGNPVYGSTFLSIAEYPANTIWVGSESGLNKIVLSGTNASGHVKQIKTFFETDGLPDKSVNGLLPDANGNLWISTIKGLVKFSVKTEKFRIYVADIDFSSASSHKVSNTTLIYGAADGFVMFNPAQVQTQSNPPQLSLASLKLFNKTVNVNDTLNGQVILHQPLSRTQHIKLNYLNNVFTIDFTGLHFANPEQNTYAYRMEGFNTEWITADAQNRSATYTNLNPGTYSFQVKAANFAGKWAAEPLTLKITILPPPWKTWWAIVVYFILFNVMLYVFIKYVLKQSRYRQQLHFEQKEKEQLKNLNQMKISFFTDVSHEFRTPLSLIVGPVEDVVSSPGLDAGLRGKMQLVHRNCKRLLYLIDELMTFQKMEQGMLKLRKTEADIVSFIKDIWQNFEPLASKKQINLNFISSISDYQLPFDAGKMEMAINNLLINAIKFTPPGGTITVQMAMLDNRELDLGKCISISVADNGKGLDEEEFRHLFERFVSNADTKGTGVGLSLTKTLVEMHQGKITASSKPGIETCFTIYLPANADGLVSNASADARSKSTEFEPAIFFPDLQETSKPETVPLLEKGDLLLLVEDNQEVLDYLELIFKDTYHIAKAVNGKAALEVLLDTAPALIISDVMMPEMDGVALCKHIKQNVDTSHIPVILLTARSAVQHKLEGLQTGADDYIAKPFYPEVLKVRVQKLIENQKRLIAKYQSDGVIVPKNITKNPLDEEFLNKVIAAVHANMSNEDFGVEELGSLVCMSRSHLFRKLKAITGQNPLDVIYSIRLKHAAELLLERKLSISQIGYEIGFKNPSSFTASFKKQFGKTPTDYLNSRIEQATSNKPIK